jgi:hypothetical protein
MSDPNTQEFQPPPPPPLPQPETPAGPSLSTGETLSGIFFEPGSVFESFRLRPRFLAPALIILALTLLFTILFFQRVGYDNVIQGAVEKSPRAAQMSPEQKEQALELYQHPVFKAINYASPLIALAIFLSAGAALYLLGTMAVGGKISYAQALAVWTYSSFPPLVLSNVANLIILFLKSADDIDPTQLNRGFVHANLGLLVNPESSPMLGAMLGSIDLLALYGLFLAALGLRKVARLSAGTAWAIVLAIWIIGVVLRVAWAAAFGTTIR